jgi:hypothetical protein
MKGCSAPEWPNALLSGGYDVHRTPDLCSSSALAAAAVAAVMFCALPAQNGEFHTFVFDGPVFSQPVAIKSGKVIERDGFVYCDVLPEDYDEALAAAEAATAEAEAAAIKQQQTLQEVDCKELMQQALQDQQQQQQQPALKPPCPIDSEKSG